jgi:hypothetical protein
MSKKKKDGRVATTNTAKTVVGKWIDGPVSVKVQGIGDGSTEQYSIQQDRSNVTGYTVVDLHEFCQSDRPCISIIEGKDNVFKMAVVTAHTPSQDAQESELCHNRIASDLLSEVTETPCMVYGNALFIPSPWVHHYPDIMWAYIKGLASEGRFLPDEE